MNQCPVDPWILAHVVCPRDKLKVTLKGPGLVCREGHRYPVVDGVPVMLLDDVPQTMDLATASWHRATGRSAGDPRAPELYLESLGISEAEKNGIAAHRDEPPRPIDWVVSFLVAATSGCSYRHLVGKLTSYPIPSLPLENAHGQLFLDLGCNWGRWCLAAARLGYEAIGIDPSLGAIMAAKRVSRQLGLSARYLVGDARYLPFPAGSIDTVFSYSVLQHFPVGDACRVIRQLASVLRPGGTCLVQMPNRLGLRSLYHQARRGFREPKGFEVRYWSIRALRRLFSDVIGPTSIEADCFFGLGLQSCDQDLMPSHLRLVIGASTLLRQASDHVAILRQVADSVFVRAQRGRSDGSITKKGVG